MNNKKPINISMKENERSFHLEKQENLLLIYNENKKEKTKRNAFPEIYIITAGKKIYDLWNCHNSTAIRCS